MRAVADQGRLHATRAQLAEDRKRVVVELRARRKSGELQLGQLTDEGRFGLDTAGFEDRGEVGLGIREGTDATGGPGRLKRSARCLPD